MRLFSLKNDIYINSVTVTYTKKNTGKGYVGLIGKHNKLLILDFFKILASLESISNLLYYHFLNNGVLLLLTDSTVLKARLVAEFSKLKNVFVSNNCQVGQISSPQFFNNFFKVGGVIKPSDSLKIVVWVINFSNLKVGVLNELINRNTLVVYTADKPADFFLNCSFNYQIVMNLESVSNISRLVNYVVKKSTSSNIL